MGYIIPPGYSRVTFELAAVSPLGSQICFGFGVDQAPTEALLDAMVSWVEENYVLRLDQAYLVTRIEARSAVEVLDRTGAWVGLRTGEPSPPNLAALARCGSGLVGRANRGRVYLPGVLSDEDVADGGQIDGDRVANLATMMGNLVLTLDSIGAQIVILHSGVGAPTPATTFSVEPVAATQRRRLRR